MKTLLRTFRRLVRVLVPAAALALLALPASAQIGRDFRLALFPDLPAGITNNATLSPTNYFIALVPGSDVSLFFSFTGHAASATNAVTVTLATGTGSAAATQGRITWTVVGEGAANSVCFTNIPASVLGPVPRLHLVSITTGATTALLNPALQAFTLP